MIDSINFSIPFQQHQNLFRQIYPLFLIRHHRVQCHRFYAHFFDFFRLQNIVPDIVNKNINEILIKLSDAF